MMYKEKTNLEDYNKRGNRLPEKERPHRLYFSWLYTFTWLYVPIYSNDKIPDILHLNNLQIVFVFLREVTIKGPLDFYKKIKF